MGKIAQRSKADMPTWPEVKGRMLAGLADTPANEFKAYQMAMGPQNVRHGNYVMAIPPIQVQRRPGEWAEPDKGLDVLDVTTDMVPEIPSIAGAIAGGAAAGLHGAAGGAIAGSLAKQRMGQRMGLRDDIDPTAAKIEGAMELAGPVLGAIPIPPIMAKTVYHGSPHKFAKFDMSKIGSATGTQAAGHGLYFADDIDLATGYQPRSTRYENSLQVVYDKLENAKTPDYDAMEIVEAAMLNKSPTQIKGLYTEANGYTPEQIKKMHGHVDKHVAPLYDAVDSGLYEVDLPDDQIEMMIDTDKKLKDQSPQVKKAVEEFYREFAPGEKPDPDMDGANLYWLTQDRGHSRKQASEWWNSKGVPGLKFLDEESRNTGGANRIYVVFNDKTPKILTRNGKPLPPDTLDPIPLTKSAASAGK